MCVGGGGGVCVGECVRGADMTLFLVGFCIIKPFLSCLLGLLK